MRDRPRRRGWSQSQIRYYVFEFLFVFDVEAVFLFPWARVFESLGWAAVVEMGIFIAMLATGLLYAWRKGSCGGPDGEKTRCPRSNRSSSC